MCSWLPQDKGGKLPQDKGWKFSIIWWFSSILWLSCRWRLAWQTAPSQRQLLSRTFWCTHTVGAHAHHLGVCIHSWHNNVSVHTRALLVYIHFFVSHSSVHEAKSLSLQISNFSNSEGICAHIYDSMMENYSHDSTPRSQMISKSLYVCGSHSKNLIWICRPLPLPQKWCPSDQ